MAKRKEREPESEREEKVPMLKSNAAKRSTTAADKRKAEKKDAETQILAQRAKDEEDEPLSTYLPLPWKGRLGYVGHPHQLPGAC